MNYLLLIYEDEKIAASIPEAEAPAYMDLWRVFTQNIAQSGHLKAGDALQPVATAKTVRVRNGETITTDGPFAETREQLGGYYLVEAKDIEEACEIAKRIPSATTGSIEVRPIMKFE
jgi:hypothetical protein